MSAASSVCGHNTTNWHKTPCQMPLNSFWMEVLCRAARINTVARGPTLFERLH
jgi:hypothetical protein